MDIWEVKLSYGPSHPVFSKVNQQLRSSNITEQRFDMQLFFFKLNQPLETSLISDYN